MSRSMNESEVGVFQSCELISNLDQSVQAEVRSAIDIATFAAGEEILQQGNKGYPFYILLSGSVNVVQDNEGGRRVKLAQLSAGTYVGEQGLLGNASGTALATVIAQEDCILAAMPAEVFVEKIASNVENSRKFDQASLIRCPPIAALNEEQQQHVLKVAKENTYLAGQDIIVQDTVGKSFYVLLEGRVDVIRVEGDGAQVKLVELDRGAYFGEQALLGRALGKRSATVRAKGPCRAMKIPGTTFVEEVAASSYNKEMFEKDASRHIYEQVSKSLVAFASNDLKVSSGSVSKVTFASGDKLVVEGEPSDCAYLILSGVAMVIKTQGDDYQELARLGNGQILGEHGVLEGKPRSATVIASSELQALRIESEAFKKWHSDNPGATNFFQSLTQVYSLSQGRKLNMFMGDVGGESAITSVMGDPAQGVVSTRVVSQGVVVFSNAKAASMDGDRESVVFKSNDIERELRVIVKERYKDKIHRCVVYGVSAKGVENDLGTLYQHVASLDEVPAVALRRFKRTGFLGAEADKQDRLCPCLGFGAREINDAVDELGNDFDTLQVNMGVSSVCGGCERAVRAHIEIQQLCGASPAPGITGKDGDLQPGQQAEKRDDYRDVPFESLSEDEQQLALLLEIGMGPEHVAVSREQIAVKLRGTGVRDMNRYIDILFPGAFDAQPRASYRALAAATGRGMGFGPWRKEAEAPATLAAKIIGAIVRGLFHLGRIRLLLGLVIGAAVSVFLKPSIAPGIGIALGIGLLLVVALATGKTGRFVLQLIAKGPARFYSGMMGVYGDEEEVGVLQFGGEDNKSYLVRDEHVVDCVLQNPDIYARNPLEGYPPFGTHSVLGGGSGGVWLGYRVLFEEYFAEGYQNDMDELREIVRERISMWEGRDSIQLLEEMFRISVEIRARLFFQTSFDCFNDQSDPDYAKIVDEVLQLPVFGLGDMLEGKVDQLQSRVKTAILGSEREGSIGRIIRDAWEAGAMSERELVENGTLYTLAQAPTMGTFWTLYRAIYTDSQGELAASRKEIVKAIKEELRLHAPVTMMFGRNVEQDTQMGSLKVREGQRVLLCPMYIHTNPQQWTDPLQHDRHRWTSSTGDSKEIVDPLTDPKDSASRPYPRTTGDAAVRYLPYGGGSQACQGRWFASEEMMIVVEEILSQYEFEIIDDGDLLGQPLKEQVMFHVYNRPMRDVKLRPKLRS
jgi:CRP-like cAMP-binding protein/cytochrome P450/bacterioferritin-associated ferredoxin